MLSGLGGAFYLSEILQQDVNFLIYPEQRTTMSSLLSQPISAVIINLLVLIMFFFSFIIMNAFKIITAWLQRESSDQNVNL